ncbi:MAG: hypothetical protein ACP5SH_20515 [Syntrophobacteraceae bacterium]
MRFPRPGFFAPAVFLAATFMVPLLFTTPASADCGGSVSRYGQCFYRDGLLVCGTCALRQSETEASPCERCRPGYRCNSRSCAITGRCADTYTCDLCGCSWGESASALKYGTQ